MNKIRAAFLTATMIGAVALTGAANAAVTVNSTGTPGAWFVVSNGNTAPAATNPTGTGTVAAIDTNPDTPNTAASSWISVDSSGQSLPGYYTYYTQITGTGGTLNYLFQVDDFVTSVLVDGAVVAATGGAGSYTSFTAGSIAGIASGTHTLAFVTSNNYPGQNNGINPAGFRLQSVAAVPEPAAWAMMVLGFGLVGAAARSRRTAVTFA